MPRCWHRYSRDTHCLSLKHPVVMPSGLNVDSQSCLLSFHGRRGEGEIPTALIRSFKSALMSKLFPLHSLNLELCLSSLHITTCLHLLFFFLSGAMHLSLWICSFMLDVSVWFILSTDQLKHIFLFKFRFSHANLKIEKALGKSYYTLSVPIPKRPQRFIKQIPLCYKLSCSFFSDTRYHDCC